jgi:hypothetical protein
MSNVSSRFRHHRGRSTQALEWIAPGDDENARAEVRDLIDEREAFLRRQLELAALRLRRRAAMHASQIARARVFPDHYERPFIEIDRLVHSSPLVRAHSRYATGEISEGLISARPPQ